MRHLLHLFVLCLVCTIRVSAYADEVPNDEIWYEASEKLSEKTSTDSGGFHPLVFNVDVSSHTFSNGKGVIKFNGSVTSIGDRAFFNCSSLTSITIPNTITSIGDYAFKDCMNLTSINIPNSVKNIGEWAFHGCSKLTSINIPNSLTSIKNNTFDGCGLTSISIPNSVKSIGSSAFGGLSITSVEIPNSVKSIGNCAFSSCFSLESVVMGDSVTSIGECAFAGCYKMTSINIPNSVKSIGRAAFSGCNQIPSIEIPDSVTSIEEITFLDCFNLASVVIGNSVTSIGDHAFAECHSLASINIPSSVKTIASCAFAGCYSLPSVEIPNSVTSIGDRAFMGCKKLASINIPNSVKIIEWNAFTNCSILPGIEIPNSVISIGHDAFNGCSSFTSIEIPNSVTSIGNAAFQNCSNLISATIGNSVTSIEGGAFSGCSKLSNINIPNSVTSFGNSVFNGCTSLPIIDGIRYADTYLVEAECDTLNTYTIKKGTRFIGHEAFSNCSRLTYINIPNSVISIEESAFYRCSSLTSVNIPYSVTSIERSAFGECSSLPSIEIPNSVASIGDLAFAHCTGLSSIKVYWSVPLSLSSVSYVFTPPFGGKNVDTKTCVLYVPQGARGLYASANVWKEFLNIQEFEIPAAINDIVDEDGNDVAMLVASGDDVTINDTYQSLSITEDIDNVNVSYSRTYKNTSWQAWYVPFGFTLTSDIASQFSFAKFAGTYTEAGQFFITLVEMQEGDEIKGNVPYFVQAKVADSSNPQVLNISNTTLYATDASGFKMLSAEKEIAIYGTYAKKVAAADDDWYAYGGGKYIKATTGQSLGAFRFYLTIRDREDNPYASTPNPIEIKVIVLGDEADGISSLNGNDSENGTMFNLAGQPVGANYKGVVIKNGKKIFKK